MVKDRILLEKRWQSRASNVQHAREAVRQALCHISCAAQLDMIELAVGEACANAVEHGSPRGESSHFGLRCLLGGNTECIFEVDDEGSEFSITDLSLASVPDLNSEGGRGLFLMNQIMDQVAIQRTAMGLNVRMTKSLNFPDAE